MSEQYAPLVTIALFFMVWTGVWVPFAAPLAGILQWHPFQPLTLQQKLPLLMSLYCLAPAVLWGFARIQGIPFANYGFTGQLEQLRSLSLGLGLGILGLLCWLGGQYSLGWLRWSGLQKTPTLPELERPATEWYTIVLSLLLLGLGVSFVEELIFRGFSLNELRRVCPDWPAAAIASIIFALLHLVWEGRTIVPQLPGLWLMGMVLSLARWVDHNQLGLAWGIHAGWIWGIASLETTQVIAYSDRAPQWLTGFDGKPLAGLLGLLLLLGTGAILMQLP
jgi:membrane protease YdiL (CAAX protease family)